MSRTYVARSPHKRPCDCCGVEVIPGDRVVTWAFVGDNGPSNSNIMRIHETCYVIQNREGLDEWHLGEAFLSRPELEQEAAAALEDARRKVLSV